MVIKVAQVTLIKKIVIIIKLVLVIRIKKDRIKPILQKMKKRKRKKIRFLNQFNSQNTLKV